VSRALQSFRTLRLCLAFIIHCVKLHQSFVVVVVVVVVVVAEYSYGTMKTKVTMHPGNT